MTTAYTVQSHTRYRGASPTIRQGLPDGLRRESYPMTRRAATFDWQGYLAIAGWYLYVPAVVAAAWAIA